MNRAPRDMYSRLIFGVRWSAFGGAAILLTITIFYASQARYKILQQDTSAHLRDLLTQERVNRAQYNALTNKGESLNIRSEYVKTENFSGEGKLAGKVRAMLDMETGRQLSVLSDMGYADQQNRVVHLSGNVSITTSDNYSLETEALKAAMDGIDMETKFPALLKTENGWISADKVTFTENPKMPRKTIATFSERVHVFYQPRIDE